MHQHFFKKTIMALIGLILLTSLLVGPAVKPVKAAGTFYVSPNGSSGNDGSHQRPWDLQTALSQPKSVTPGSGIIVLAGIYSGKFTVNLKGTADGFILVRAQQGQRVVLTNSSGPAMDIAEARYVNFLGLEISGPNSKRSTSRSESTYGVRVNQGKSSHHVNFINMIFHDNQSQGIGWWQALEDSQIYGSLFYHNGTTELDHGVYIHSAKGSKTFKDNMVFNNASHGFHGYAETNEKGLNNITLIGNTFFNNGSIGYNTRKGKYGMLNRNILLGGLIRANNTKIIMNFTYQPGSEGTSLNLGYKGGSSSTLIQNNFFMGGQFAFGASNSNVQMTGNAIYAPGGVNGVSKSSFGANSWMSSKPTGIQAFVRPNHYEPGRANITIYNWSKSPTVYITAAQLAGTGLRAGQKFELHAAQNYFGDIIWGTYDGKGISIPMTNHSVAQPYGLSFKPASTFPEFGAFILIGK